MEENVEEIREEISIEIGENFVTENCLDCGSQTRTVNGYVYTENCARAIYYARWTDSHLERGIQILLSIGQWGEGTTGEVRRRIGVACRMYSNGPAFMIVDASELPWDDEEFLGRALTRQGVLNGPAKEEVFSILDRLVFDDHRIKAFLYSEENQ
ncbi:MAG: hypothetical protein QG574_2574 [Cyanobacteriota bacterium erpe_2018_sw_21hr_WHONDRS-SW48-000092_B_bin.40]|nr:hypothetical protein [Cyanobacteriota bacterium erpe_2018_sw_21hr_WHONDRS-SW48-000092_B_bin.40]